MLGRLRELDSSKGIGAALGDGDPKGMVLTKYVSGDPAAVAAPWEAGGITSALSVWPSG